MNDLYEFEKTKILCGVKFNVYTDDNGYLTFIPIEPLYISCSFDNKVLLLTVIAIEKGRYRFKLMVPPFGYYDPEELENCKFFLDTSKELLEKKIELSLLLG